MFHHVVRSVPGVLLFRDWTEARALWVRVVSASPGLHALCLMPDHLHLLHPRPVRRELGVALAAYARLANHRRGRQGPLVRPTRAPEEVVGATKTRRSIRYVHLNPCRAGLAADPVAWAFSTHLDALGLSAPAARPAARDPLSFHRWVSADPTVHVQGTDLPVPPAGLSTLRRVLAAVSVATRTPATAVLSNRSPQRRLFLSQARGLTDASVAQIAHFTGISSRTVQRAKPAATPRIAALAADSRIRALCDVELQATLARSSRWPTAQTRPR